MVYCAGWSGVLAGLGVVLASLAFLVSIKGEGARGKLTPFECGFDPRGSGRVPFSLRFFLLGVVFLVFDVEIALLLPMTVSEGALLGVWSVLAAVFLSALLAGTLHEWREGALDWEL
uniref:NADH-ubiquinone oxidoreductase chain 3 n=1 Tax=Sphaeroma serratum TaxID=96875 RepID=E3SXC4_SPHSR|nr:NADH dehydrogenase subunit 3 [Sphaeroma serratum]